MKVGKSVGHLPDVLDMMLVMMGEATSSLLTRLLRLSENLPDFFRCLNTSP